MPRSRVDYATDTITVYRYCSYGCLYCWAWRIPLFASRIKRGKYDPVEEARRYTRVSGRTIVVSFSSDPYQPEEKVKQLTRKVLEILARTNNRVLVLTKNPVMALRDIDIMKQGNIWLGTTITTLDCYYARRIEPRAPDPFERISALWRAHRAGVKTWLSIEPIIPHVTRVEEIVETTVSFVDWYVLGAYNYWRRLSLPELTRYNPLAQRFETIDPSPACEEELKLWYQERVKRAIEILKKHRKPFFIKKELRRYLENG